MNAWSRESLGLMSEQNSKESTGIANGPAINGLRVGRQRVEECCHWKRASSYPRRCAHWRAHRDTYTRVNMPLDRLCQAGQGQGSIQIS